METNKTKNTDLFLIDPRNIVVVDGFNVRRDFDLDELKEQVKAAKSAVDNAKENGRVTATNKEVLNSLKDSKEAKAIAEALRKVWAYLDGEVIVDVDKLARLLDKTESLSQAMREYKKGGIK